MAPVAADVLSPVTLPYAQSWSDPNLITTDDSWTGVPGVQGYLGDVDAGMPLGVDARTVTVENTATDGIANQSNPATQTTGGVAEFDAIADPVVALQGSGSADAPNLVFRVGTTGRQNLTLSFNARDIDGSVDNAVQQVAVQYRIGAAGSYTRAGLGATDGYVADATTGPSLATLVTPVSVTLPDATDNQAAVYLRVLTTNAAGNDEWVGIDDVSITAPVSPPPPPPPAPPPPPIPPADVVSFSTSPKSLRVSKTGRFTYPFLATPLKSGTLRLKSTKKVKIGAKKQTMKLAAKSFTAPSTATVKVKIKLSKKHLRALKKVKTLRFKVTATFGGKTFTTTLTLKRPKTS